MLRDRDQATLESLDGISAALRVFAPRSAPASDFAATPAAMDAMLPALEARPAHQNSKSASAASWVFVQASALDAIG